ncbi:hypothetical protein C7S20_09080 [Christiangramia fulva]|uniref:GIY-YIG domain-containing protein n=1 Tax=Christiangramia fulva TaxID=2126553 RepID=A0A2R3Z568_9FLAO|nr:GIY-YIG nuclease family protein [Christiangramia fulva]AVR45411.1 hypothetical protein C7S20_09080 [Christiangramia fulva]
MKLYYVYILLCSDGLTYTGITNNPDRRLEEHQTGLNRESFTYRRRPVKLIFQQDFNDVNQAIYFEKKIKKWSADKKLALANGDYDLLQLLAECRNETNSKLRNTGIGLDSARPDTTNNE